jgi:hypothetical protein
MAMVNWKRKQIKKKNGSQTTGRSKGIIASSLQRYMCRANRSHKHRLYSVIMGHGEFTRKAGKK